MISIIRKKLGDLLVDVGKISKEQLIEALDEQKKSENKLGEILVRDGYVSEKDIIQVLEYQYGIPYVDLDKYFIDPNTTSLISEKLAKKHTLIPIKKTGNTILVSMLDPLNLFAIDDVEIATGLKVQPAISTKSDILRLIDNYYGKQSAEKAVEDFKKQYNVKDFDNIDEQVLNDINNAPVVRLVNSIIRQAIKARASDIHIEPFESRVRIRFRIDGNLQEIMTPSKSTHSAIITRIKIMANMDIAEKRLPQDGRVEIKQGDTDVDLRISILPTVFGEKIVIRLLDRNNFIKSKYDLGLSHNNIIKFSDMLKNPHGIILISGPTGSGKTTTLYTILKELNTINKNLITVEDPVEYSLDGINQVQVNSKIGLNFADGLRSILRQDPDIIMIGEIRDTETAQIAVRAAITGHLVISTIHTNDAPSTITRLIDMGIKPYLISGSVVSIVAQRLVRKICPVCKVKYKPDEYEMKTLDIDKNTFLYKGKGCSKCYNTGYIGRTGIHEIMYIDNEIRNLIDNKSSITTVRLKAKEKGMISLIENCKELVLKGITTIDELSRITYMME
ncbi:GspE/PulE family protein [Abyssisolibacter fermentans]|uniref:GspE/PulE family protein n=1 Tax=Abyssisolibacter fermentans TaxID=1766203 RepID=UPI000A730EED|nr:GspE/PulE family protein [Abyssisolibacter fermentans]